MSTPHELPNEYDVEIHDDIGYTRDVFELADIPEPARQVMAQSPDATEWVWSDADGGTWTIAVSE